MHKSYKLITILMIGVLLVGASVAYQMLQRQKTIISQKQTEVDSLKKSADIIHSAFGESLFMKNCRQCHVSKSMNHNLLDGVVERRGDRYVILYLTKQDSLINAKDEYAIEIKTKYNNQGNSHNYNFTRPELEAIIAYLKNSSTGN